MSSEEKLFVAGILTLPEFQKAKHYAEKLYSCYPQKFAKPEIRPMMDVAWQEYIVSMQRKLGGNLWKIKLPVAVFHNGLFLNYDQFFDYVDSIFKFFLNEDYHYIAEIALMNELEKISSNGRKLVYLSVTIVEVHIGTLLFMLYSDLVPKTCDFFIERCFSTTDGWPGTKIVRIQLHSFLQCGSIRLHKRKLPCENYAIPHDRRGILSTCNIGKHKNNSLLFTISLAATPWMDYRYVGFGQLIHGEDILQQIEQLQTLACSPIEDVYFNRAGVYETCDEEKKESPLNLPKKSSKESVPSIKESFPSQTDSTLSADKYMRDLYCLKTDLRSHKPFCHLPKHLLRFIDSEESEEVNEKSSLEAEPTPRSFGSLTIRKSMQFKSSDTAV